MRCSFFCVTDRRSIPSHPIRCMVSGRRKRAAAAPAVGSSTGPHAVLLPECAVQCWDGMGWSPCCNRPAAPLPQPSLIRPRVGLLPDHVHTSTTHTLHVNRTIQRLGIGQHQPHNPQPSWARTAPCRPGLSGSASHSHTDFLSGRLWQLHAQRLRCLPGLAVVLGCCGQGRQAGRLLRPRAPVSIAGRRLGLACTGSCKWLQLQAFKLPTVSV